MPRRILYFKRNDGQIFQTFEGSALHERLLSAAEWENADPDRAARVSLRREEVQKVLSQSVASHHPTIGGRVSPWSFVECGPAGDPLPS